MEQLMQKLAMAKAIMDKTEGIQTSGNRRTQSSPMVENYDMPQAKYNIPSEYLTEQPRNTQQPQIESYAPRENTKPVGVPTVDAIKNSKLPDEIKRLMMEHPIAQSKQPEVTLSNDLIERAARLMNENKGNDYKPESAKSPSKSQPTASIDYNLIKEMIEDAIDNALRRNGLMVESTQKSNEVFTFKVGSHQFEGKVTKIKKLM